MTPLYSHLLFNVSLLDASKFSVQTTRLWVALFEKAVKECPDDENRDYCVYYKLAHQGMI